MAPTNIRGTLVTIPVSIGERWVVHLVVDVVEVPDDVPGDVILERELA